MGVITKIEDQKNKKRFNIFIDNAFFCGLLKETAVLAGLKVGKEVNEEQLEKLILDSETKMAFEKACTLLEVRAHSKKEIFDKLLTKGYAKDVVKSAISKLEEYHYIDDELFAKAYVEQNHKYSRLMLENKLLQKGIDKDVIKDVFDNLDDDQELELCGKQLKKYLNGKDLNQEGIKEKAIASLARKGFKFDTIKQAMKRFSLYNELID